MWILPSSITSAFAAATAASTSDSDESLASACEQSLIRRSKPSRASCYLREWKAGNLIRLRSGLISRPSRGQDFVGWWTSSLAATRASHSAQPESDLAPTTRAICGHTYEQGFLFADLDCASSRTSKDISAWGCATFCATWPDWVTERRGAYSARLKSARRTSASGCSSWPTIRASEYKDVGPVGSKSHDHMLGKNYLCAVVTQEEAEQHKHGHPAPAIHSTDGSRRESWATPRSGNPGSRKPGTGGKVLSEEVKAWASPQARDYRTGEESRWQDANRSRNLNDQNNGKLNPRWVETLMGLPVGWTMPSCAAPVTIAPTSCDCLATELCQLPQSLPLEPCLKN